MNDEQAFLQALTADPDDDTTRLVYADWLQERGDPRAEYIRLEHGVRVDGLREVVRLAELRKSLDANWVRTVFAGRLGPNWAVVIQALLASRAVVAGAIRDVAGVTDQQAITFSGRRCPWVLFARLHQHEAHWWRQRLGDSVLVSVEYRPG